MILRRCGTLSRERALAGATGPPVPRRTCVLGQPENGHLPPEHPDALAADGQAPPLQGVRPLLSAWAAKADTCLTIFFEPHLGQGGLVEKLATSSSALLPQPSQTYS